MQRVSITSGIHGTTYFFDTTFKESHSFTNIITQNPVQTGAAVNDHVYQQPIMFSWDVGVSDCKGSLNGLSFSTGKQAFDALEKMWQEADMLTITTEFKQYTNMIIKSFVVVRDKVTMTAMRATVVFQQVIVTDAVEISVSQKNTSAPQTTGKTNGGTKATKQAKTNIVKIKDQDYTTDIKVKYGGKTFTLEDYLIKYANQSCDIDNGIWKITLSPILSSSVANGSTFIANGQTLSYDQFASKYS